MMFYSAHSRKSRVRHIPGFNLAAFRRVGTLLLITSTVLLLLLKLATWLYAEDTLFQLKEISITGNRFATDAELLRLVAIDSSQSLLKCDLKQISASLEQHPLLEKVWVKRILPSTLYIQVQEYQPIATYNKDGLGALDSHGHLLQKIKPEMLVDQPVITNVSALRPKDGGVSELEQVLAFLQATRQGQFDLYARISEISYDKDIGIYFYLTDHTVPVIVGTKGYLQKGKNF
jgi:cell division septal protein FtsQ